MFLQKLKEYAGTRMDSAPPLYKKTPIAYIVALDEDGKPLSPAPISTANPKEKSTRRGVERAAPDIVRSSGVKPLLLADKGDYTFGLIAEGGKQARADECHRAYLALLDECAAATGEPAVLAVQQFYRDGGKDLLELPDDYDPSNKVTFRVASGFDTIYPIDVPSVQAFWAAKNDVESDGAVTMQCLVCGQQRPIVERLQAKVKGVHGGQTSGTSIISANADAFESYGLKASQVGPTCANCGEQFTRALNHLIAGESTHLYLADTTFVFWTRNEVSFNAAKLLSAPEARQVHDLIESARTGRRQPEIEEVAFYAAALSSSGGRTVIRDWIDTTVGDVQRALAHWFTRQRIVDINGEEAGPLGIFRLAVATVRDAKDLPVTTSRALLRSALTSTPPPRQLLEAAYRRSRAEQNLYHNRAALIKLLLHAEGAIPHEDSMTALEPDNPSAAYQCGRLMATLERIQRAAIPGINATIIDRYFGAASTTPALVFPRLIRGAQPHLAKLERDRKGAYVNLQREMEAILDHVEPGEQGYPPRLSFTEQGLFQLGYYHQRAWARAQINRRRQAGELVEDDIDPTNEENED